jgi:quercetin dioxygenase-like cupin family protein
MSKQTSAVAVAPGEGVTLRNPVGGAVTFKLRAPESGRRLTAFETVVAPGEGPPLHVHASQDEVLYVLEGDVRFRLGEELHAAPVGTFVFIPPGTPHTFRNDGSEPARLLVLFTPSGMEGFFERIHAAGVGPGDRDGFVRAAAPVGMQVVGPPLAADQS